MKSVSFLRNALRRRDNDRDVDHKHVVQKGRGQLPTSRIQHSAAKDCATKPPVLPITITPPSLHAGLDTWLNDSCQDSNLQSIPNHQASPMDHRAFQHDSSLPIHNFIPFKHAGPSNLRHGPPRNAIHGPPGISHPLTVEADVSDTPYSTASIRRAHRPPKIKVYPPSYKARETTSCSAPAAKSRSPERVTFVVPLDPSSSPSSSSTLRKDQASNPYIPVALHPESADCEDEGEFPANNKGMYRRSSSSCLNESPIAQAKVDYSLSQMPKLYRDAGSSPHLPYLEPRSAQLRKDAPFPEPLVDSDDPISLFPSPPPLVIRKKAPQPLILRPTPTIAPLPPSPCFSSYDSTPPTTPVTPMTPRQQPPSRPSSQGASKYLTGRSPGVIPPPLFSPPTSPLPALPETSVGSFNNSDYTRPLRITKSASHLRSEINYASATHRITCSEPVSEVSSKDAVTAEKRVNSHSYAQVHRKKLPASSVRTTASSDARVQWGYAL